MSSFKINNIMESLDIISKEKVQFTFKGSRFKTTLGGLLTLLQVIASVTIIVILAARKYENSVNVYTTDKSSYREEYIFWLVKIPKKYVGKLYWVEEFPQRLSGETIKECTEEEYKYFYNTTTKEADMTYFCRTRNELSPFFDHYRLVSCAQINEFYYGATIKDKLSCDKTVEIDRNDFKGEYWISYNFYNETYLEKNKEVLKQRNSFSAVKEKNYFNYDFQLRSTYVNTNPFVDDVQVYFWRFLQNLYTENNVSIFFQLNFHNNGHVSKIVVSEKLNEKLISILSIVSIINLLFYLVSNYFSKFYFQLYVLETAFSNEELININNKLKLTNSSDPESFNRTEFLNKIKNDFFNIYNKLKDLISTNLNFLIVENMIKEKLSLEQILKKTYIKDKPSKADLVYNRSNFNEGISGFVRNMDFFSKPYKLKLKKSSTVKTSLGSYLSMAYIILSGLVIYYFGYNFVSNKNANISTYVININTLSDHTDPKLDTLLMFTLTKEYADMTIPVGFDYQVNQYRKIPYAKCTQEEIDSFNVKFPSNKNLAHICVHFYDIFDNVYGERSDFFDQELHFVNCNQIPYLGYKESDCGQNLLNIGDPLYVRLDAWSNSINPLEKEYKTKVHKQYEEPNLYYNYDDNNNYGFFIVKSIGQEFYENKNKIIPNYKRENIFTTEDFFYLRGKLIEAT